MPTSTTRIAGLLRTAGLIVLSLLLLGPLLYYPFARDHGMYAVVADTMARGGMPYADAWDLKTPGIFLTFRTALGLFGKNMWGIRVLELIFLTATALVLCRLGRRLMPELPETGTFGAAWFLLFAAHYLNYWHTAQAESFLMLPLVLSIHLTLGALSDTRRKSALLRAGLAGLCIGLVFVFKFPNVLPLACCLPLLFRTPSSGEAPGRPLLLACFTGGALLVTGITAAWFALSGAWAPMVETLFVFVPRYAGITASTGLLAHGLKVFYGFFLTGEGLMLVKWLALGGLVTCLRSKTSAGRFTLPLWFLLSLAVIWLQGKFFLYHYLPLYLPLALLAGAAAARLTRVLADRVRGTEKEKRIVRHIQFTVLLLLPFLFDLGTLPYHWRTALAAHPVTAGGPGMEQYRDGTDFSLSADLEMADYLRKHTGPEETVFIWGYETLVYFLADRQPASRFVSHQPLASRWQMPGWREELLANLVARPPARILVLRNDAMPAVTGSTLDSAGLLREFPELDQFISRNYGLETEIEDFLVYGPLNAGGS
jgi:hypothetical protein